MSGSGHVIHKDKSQTPGQDSLLLFWKFIFLWNIYLSLKLEKNPPTAKEQVFIREEITCRSSQRRRVASNACSVTALPSTAQQGVPPVHLKWIFKCWQPSFQQKKSLAAVRTVSWIHWGKNSHRRKATQNKGQCWHKKWCIQIGVSVLKMETTSFWFSKDHASRTAAMKCLNSLWS